MRELFKKISKQLVHEGDLFGIVSSGPSSIAIDMTYDRKRLDEAINKIAGRRPEAERDHPDGDAAPKARPNCGISAHVAFSTMHEALENLEKVHNRRKALVWVSEGLRLQSVPGVAPRPARLVSPFLQNQSNVMLNNTHERRRVDEPDTSTR